MPPRHKRMKREGRLQAARHWLPKYEGKNILKGYKNHFGVDWLCAITELQMLDVKLDPSYVAKIKQSVENQIKARQNRKQEQFVHEHCENSDETFAYIAGYTPAGFPYGITWEEVNEEAPYLDNRDGLLERSEDNEGRCQT